MAKTGPKRKKPKQVVLTPRMKEVFQKIRPRADLMTIRVLAPNLFTLSLIGTGRFITVQEKYHEVECRWVFLVSETTRFDSVEEVIEGLGL